MILSPFAVLNHDSIMQMHLHVVWRFAENQLAVRNLWIGVHVSRARELTLLIILLLVRLPVRPIASVHYVFKTKTRVDDRRYYNINSTFDSVRMSRVIIILLLYVDHNITKSIGNYYSFDISTEWFDHISIERSATI